MYSIPFAQRKPFHFQNEDIIKSGKVINDIKLYLQFEMLIRKLIGKFILFKKLECLTTIIA